MALHVTFTLQQCAPSAQCAPRRSTVKCAATSQMASTGNGAAAAISGETFIRPHLLKLAPYTPILPFDILSAQLGRKPQDIIKLDANENPYGPPPEVPKALGAMEFPNIYPDPESRRLREALAKWHGVPMEHLLVRGGAWRWAGGRAGVRRDPGGGSTPAKSSAL